MSVRRSARSISFWVFLLVLTGPEIPDRFLVHFSSSMLSARQVYAQSNVCEDELFKQMITQAGIAYKERRFEDAIKYFEDAMLLRSNPNIHWNLSVCYHKLKNLQKSLYHINLYLKEGNPTKDMKLKVESRRREILRELKRKLDGTHITARLDDFAFTKFRHVLFRALTVNAVFDDLGDTIGHRQGKRCCPTVVHSHPLAA